MANRLDQNQAAIVANLIQIGASVQPLNKVKDDCPDLLVGYHGINYVIEIKNPETGFELSPGQVKWQERWRGTVYTVKFFEDILAIFENDTRRRK